FPTMIEPDTSYHGVVWTDAFGPAAYITRARTVLMRNLGTTISPFTAWLQLASLETLPLRMERHSSNGLAIARHLAAHPAVSWVAYPGLPGTSDRANADKCFTGRGYSGLLSFGVAAGRAAAADFVDALDLFADVTNIGDTKSLVTHSASTTHSQLSDAELRAAGVAPEAVRLSVGIEDVGDLVDDLDQALAHAG
ncbi:MAG: PLP-dependent transferase, partial [Actinomycetia bacterium]|nr:PLP-dependent transferase [Actinomycetes bacterium]